MRRHVLKAVELCTAARSCRYVWNSQKVYAVTLAPTQMATRHSNSVREAHQQRAIDRLLAQVYDELLQRHGLVVDADEEVA
jgi:hypothetical protein